MELFIAKSARVRIKRLTSSTKVTLYLQTLICVYIAQLFPIKPVFWLILMYIYLKKPVYRQIHCDLTLCYNGHSVVHTYVQSTNDKWHNSISVPSMKARLSKTRGRQVILTDPVRDECLVHDPRVGPVFRKTLKSLKGTLLPHWYLHHVTKFVCSCSRTSQHNKGASVQTKN